MAEQRNRRLRKRQGDSETNPRSLVMVILALGLVGIALVIAVGYSAAAYKSGVMPDAGGLEPLLQVLGEVFKAVLNDGQPAT
mgnify:CR=1 FL=1